MKRLFSIVMLGTLLSFTLGSFMAPAVAQEKQEKQKKEEKTRTLYVFGVGASFNDSIVYFSAVQPLDSAVLVKGAMLRDREQYSYQLKNYIEAANKKQNYTCMIYFAKNQKALKKEELKVRAKYAKAQGVKVENIAAEDFAFSSELLTTDEE